MNRQQCVVLAWVTALLLLGAPDAVFAQRTAATLSGTVTDPAGALVPGAHITVTNAATGLTLAVSTNEAVYVIPNLAAGTHRVATEAAVFRPVRPSVREYAEAAAAGPAGQRASRGRPGMKGSANAVHTAVNERFGILAISIKERGEDLCSYAAQDRVTY